MRKKYDSKALFARYKAGTCTEEEKAIVESWHIQSISQSRFMPDEEELNRAGKEIWAGLPVHQFPNKRGIPLWAKYFAAACIVLIGMAIFFFDRTPEVTKPLTMSERYKDDVTPGGNKATLVLADGRQVMLDQAGNGVLASQGQTSILKTNEGELIYSNSGTSTEPLVNKLSTPKGGQYKVILPDGSKVWLNSASSISYPTAFTGTDREIQLSGEAYLEVARNKKQPFIVHTGKQRIEVIGTHFNVNSYPTENAIRTTLLEGKVNVIVDQNSYPLQPGQQAAVGNLVSITTADLDQAVAWMRGDFVFKDENIQRIMHKLERWYDIEVVYEGKIKDVDFGAEISKDRNLSQILKILEETGDVHFRIQGRRVTVMP